MADHKPNTTEEYVASLPADRQEVIERIRATLQKHLPEGFDEQFTYGMIGYVVPLSYYPKGYHVNQEQPLPFINLASQKNHIALYHMGLYANEELMNWFTSAWKVQVPYKLDMGKSCIRFKKIDKIPFDLIAQLAEQMSVDEWVEQYEELRPAGK